MPGVYKVRVEFGRDITTISDEVLLLDRNHIRRQRRSSPARRPTPESDVGSVRAAADRRGTFTGPAAGKAAISGHPGLDRCEAPKRQDPRSPILCRVFAWSRAQESRSRT